MVDDEENVHNDHQPIKKAGEGRQTDGVKRLNVGGRAGGQLSNQQAVGGGRSKPLQSASPRKPINSNNSKNVNHSNNSNARGGSRNLNGVSPASKNAIAKLRRPNLKRTAVMNLLRNNNDNGANNSFLSRNNDLNDLGGSNYNRGGGGGGGGGNSGAFDDFGIGRRNSDNYDLGFTRRNNLGTATEEIARNLALGLDLRLGGNSFGSNNGNSFGRNFNNGNRF